MDVTDQQPVMPPQGSAPTAPRQGDPTVAGPGAEAATTSPSAGTATVPPSAGARRLPPPPPPYPPYPPYPPASPYVSYGPPKPQYPPAPRSRLAPLVVSVALLVTGVLGVVDLAGASIWPSAYFALPLFVVAVGMLVGATAGRARWLIVVGVPLLAALGIACAVEAVDEHRPAHSWKPMSLTELDRTYRIGSGNAVLDLTAVRDWGRATVDVRSDVGNVTVIAPTYVDVRVSAEADVGSIKLFGRQYSGIGNSATLTDLGPDGTGGGELNLTVSVDVGDIVVKRG